MDAPFAGQQGRLTLKVGKVEEDIRFVTGHPTMNFGFDRTLLFRRGFDVLEIGSVPGRSGRLPTRGGESFFGGLGNFDGPKAGRRIEGKCPGQLGGSETRIGSAIPNDRRIAGNIMEKSDDDAEVALRIGKGFLAREAKEVAGHDRLSQQAVQFSFRRA